MLATVQPMQTQRRVQVIPRNLFGFAKRITGPLNDKAGALQHAKVLGAHTFGLARWMERITEADKPRRPDLCRKHAGNTPPHRLATDKESPLQLRRLEPKRLLQHAHRVGRALAAGTSALRHVGKLEAQHAHSARCQRSGQQIHERAVHGRACAMSEHQLRDR